jgi:hypothetical protein
MTRSVLASTVNVMTQPWTAPEPERIDPDLISPERPSLEQWLDYQRQTLLLKCTGLSDQQLKEASAPPSNLTLLGLVRHMAEVERWWFRNYLAGQDLPDLFCTEDNRDADFDDVATADPAADFAAFEVEVEEARRAAAAVSLDHVIDHARWGEDGRRDLRWVFVHMIEEYARHNGHADLLRERIDGVTGD